MNSHKNRAATCPSCPMSRTVALFLAPHVGRDPHSAARRPPLGCTPGAAGKYRAALHRGCKTSASCSCAPCWRPNRPRPVALTQSSHIISADVSYANVFHPHTALLCFRIIQTNFRVKFVRVITIRFVQLPLLQHVRCHIDV